MENKGIKTTTIRLPLALWKKLKTLEIDGGIASIQSAAIEGLKLVIESREKFLGKH